MSDKAPALTDVKFLIDSYYKTVPDPDNPAQKVAFGTSGHRGTSLNGGFTEAHVLAVTQAVCEYRQQNNIAGPLFMGMDTHALSAPAHRSALEVLAANEVEARIQEGLDAVPTPVISHNILEHNRKNPERPGDGIVITPSHNPPRDGGFKYNPPHGGPADTKVTAWIERRANELLAGRNMAVKRLPYERAVKAPCVQSQDLIQTYIENLGQVLDMPAIAASGLRLGADPLGGSTLSCWGRIAERHGLNLEIVNPALDPTFAFMPPDHDGKIRMDCSSPWAMAGLIKLAARYDLSFGNDPDGDRHGIVTSAGLMNPNHYLAACVWYLFRNRPGWRKDAAVGKTLVTSSLLDRVAQALERELYEVPVGFKWFVPGLLDGGCAFGGEESAGASFLTLDGRAWSTDKDGLILALLAAEMTAKSHANPAGIYAELTGKFGTPYYERMDAPATAAQKKILASMTPELVKAKALAGESITAVFTRAPGNDAPIGGLKVATRSGWFAARPSGTEDIYKIYAESFIGREHLGLLQKEAQAIVNAALASCHA